MIAKKWYVGVKYPGWHCDIFSATDEPTQATHGSLYAYCFGGYKTKIKAVEVAMYQNFAIDTPQPDRRSFRRSQSCQPTI